MPLVYEPYAEQVKVWPKTGRHILAQYDDDSVVVYQAYTPTISRYAIEHGRFGGDFSYSRMSWVKPNFLWMMYRSGWGTKENQEVTLGLRVRRVFFDSLLAEAVPSSWDRDMYPTSEDWPARRVGLPSGSSGIPTTIRRERSSNGERFNSGCAAQFWRRLGRTNCWK